MRISDVNGHLKHEVKTHKGRRSACPGCEVCQRKNAGRTGKGAALRLATREPDDETDAQDLREDTP